MEVAASAPTETDQTETGTPGEKNPGQGLATDAETDATDTPQTAAPDDTPQTAVPDGECVRRMLAGDEDAFALLVERYEARVRKLAFGFVRDFELAEDIAQDTFLQAYRRIRSLQNPDVFRSWLFSIAINRARDEIRRLARFTEVGDLEASLREFRQDPSAERLLQSRELGRWLSRLIAQLPDKQRVPLLLKEISGMTYAEIAEMLRIPMGTVQIRVHRGRLHLRKKIEGLGLRRNRKEGE